MNVFPMDRRRTETLPLRLAQLRLTTQRKTLTPVIVVVAAGIALFMGPGRLLWSAKQGEANPAKQGQADQAKPSPEPAKPRLAAEFHQDFRNAALDTRTMARVGGYAEEFVRPDKEGLRIRIPPGLNNPEAVGVGPRFRIRGDFEITVSFSIVKADQPIRGYGVAATLWAETTNPTRDAVTIERGIIPKEGERFTSTHVTGPSRTRKYDVRRARAQFRSGKLRMEREGAKVTTSYADGDKPFRALRTVNLGPEDVALLRLGAETGMSDHSVEIRLEDLTIRALALPGLRLPPPTAGSSPSSTPPER